ncbi:MAG TPA: class I SAM-dependent methyltransferase [Thermoleophilaceae bacterium]|nr:class I SAM-dependent methyltransferase [Thermoleophilaceae bacterium]
MPAPTADQIRERNARYHDMAAGGYDSKWGIAFDAGSRAWVLDKLRLALGREPGRFGRSLEIGAGTGYFTLNLLAAGTVREAVATDISQGMLDALEGSAGHLGLAVETRRAEAAELPFPDGSFDLVLGHAVLHHLPDLSAAFAELRRVLSPGGTLVFCGEPSRHGDRLAALPKRAAVTAAPAWRFLMRASERRDGAGGAGESNGAGGDGGSNGGAHLAEHELEWLVDVHSFAPRDLVELAERAGLEHVRVRGEELTSSWFGWVSRTLEGSAEPAEVPALWRWYAYGGYLALRELDRRLLEPRLPAALFYNLLLSARAP